MPRTVVAMVAYLKKRGGFIFRVGEVPPINRPFYWGNLSLWFSDFYAHAVKSITEAGEVRTELVLDDQPSGLGWLPDGRLLVVSMKERAVKR